MWTATQGDSKNSHKISDGIYLGMVRREINFTSNARSSAVLGVKVITFLQSLKQLNGK